MIAGVLVIVAVWCVVAAIVSVIIGRAIKVADARDGASRAARPAVRPDGTIEWIEDSW